ncbi:MAG: DUF1345 domain-containing protein [Sheuella sp.]|nr:DUF1345 domain-containing protein [Sheuella sp.]
MIRVIKARPILSTSVVIGVVSAILISTLTQHNNWIILVLSWNIGSCLYLFLTFKLMFEADPDKVRANAIRQNTGNYVILMLVVFSAIVCLIANVMVLGISKAMEGNDQLFHILLAALTIITSWTFTQVMFAVHYAHDFYTTQANKSGPGLLFPGHEQPDYLDFLYFSCMIGTSAQTSDVSITTKSMRRVCLLHCVMAYFFNTTLIALTINIAAGFI